jgi:hypothetical protein
LGKGFLFIGKWFLILSAAPMFAHILFPHDADVAWRGAFDILFIGCFVAHATRGRLSRMLFGKALVVLALLPLAAAPEARRPISVWTATSGSGATTTRQPESGFTSG